MAARNGAVTVSTYVVRFVSFLAEYFSWHPFHPMFTGIRRGLLAGSTLALRSNTAPSRSRLGDALNLPSRDREGVGGRYRRTVRFRLRRVRKRDLLTCAHPIQNLVEQSRSTRIHFVIRNGFPESSQIAPQLAVGHFSPGVDHVGIT